MLALVQFNCNEFVNCKMCKCVHLGTAIVAIVNHTCTIAFPLHESGSAAQNSQDTGTRQYSYLSLLNADPWIALPGARYDIPLHLSSCELCSEVCGQGRKIRWIPKMYFRNPHNSDFSRDGFHCGVAAFPPWNPSREFSLIQNIVGLGIRSFLLVGNTITVMLTQTTQPLLKF